MRSLHRLTRGTPFPCVPPRNDHWYPLPKSDLQLLDFVINRFFMKLFTTKSSECKQYFDFSLPSVLLAKRVSKIEISLELFCLRCNHCVDLIWFVYGILLTVFAWWIKILIYGRPLRPVYVYLYCVFHVLSCMCQLSIGPKRKWWWLNWRRWRRWLCCWFCHGNQSSTLFRETYHLITGCWEAVSSRQWRHGHLAPHEVQLVTGRTRRRQARRATSPPARPPASVGQSAVGTWSVSESEVVEFDPQRFQDPPTPWGRVTVR